MASERFLGVSRVKPASIKSVESRVRAARDERCSLVASTRYGRELFGNGFLLRGAAHIRGKQVRLRIEEVQALTGNRVQDAALPTNRITRRYCSVAASRTSGHWLLLPTWVTRPKRHPRQPETPRQSQRLRGQPNGYLWPDTDQTRCTAVSERSAEGRGSRREALPR